MVKCLNDKTHSRLQLCLCTTEEELGFVVECMYAFGANNTHVYSLPILSWHIFLYIVLFYLQLMAAYIRNIVNCKYEHHVTYGSTKLK